VRPVSWLRAQLRLGIFGEGWRSAVVTLALGVAAIGASLFYDALNHGPSVLFLRTPLDDLIPVVGPFAVPYVSLRPFIYVSAVLFLLFRARIYRSAATSMIVVLLVSYAFYAFLQTYIDRPLITGDDLFSRMIRDVYASDQPYNDFPSLHASLSTIFAVHWLRVDRRIGLPIAIWAALIVVSTVFVKQHYVPDVIAGVLLASVTSWWSLRLLAGPVGPTDARASLARSASA
jgi:membrane-associated phospholipid phosphatase